MLKPKQLRKSTLASGVIGLAVVMLGEYLYPDSIVKFIGMGILIVAVLLHVIFYRCPHCNRFLSKNTGKFCPYCGENMEEDHA